MKRIFYLIVSVLLLSACGSSEHRQIRGAVERQMADFPESSLLDIYKSFFQDNFGPGHIVSDTTAACNYIRRELAEARRYDRHYFEPAGRGENYYRVSLAVIADSIVPFDTFFNAFYVSVKDVQPVDIELWRQQWQDIVKVIDGMNLNLPDYDRDKASLDSLLASGAYAWHHSRRYNYVYEPHYRLMKREIFESDIKPLIDSTRVY